MNFATWLIYLVAAVGLSVTPGPNSLLAITHGALYGYRRTTYTVLGGVVGFVLLIGVSMLGIGALLQSSAKALQLLKWVGGAYLFWLGIQLFRAPALALDLAKPVAMVSNGALARQGFLAAVSNPKVLLFYGAFLPQFIDPQRSLWLQFVIMAGTFAVTELVVEIWLARLATVIRPWLIRTGKRFNQACGGLFMALGLALPLAH